jgi:hypothetical protein
VPTQWVVGVHVFGTHALRAQTPLSQTCPDGHAEQSMSPPQPSDWTPHMPASNVHVLGVQVGEGQAGDVAPETLLSVNWIAGDRPLRAQQEPPTRLRLFVSPV